MAWGCDAANRDEEGHSLLVCDDAAVDVVSDGVGPGRQREICLAGIASSRMALPPATMRRLERMIGLRGSRS